MSATYPSSIRNFTDKQDNVDEVVAKDINDAYDEIEAIEGELGVSPSGGYSTIKARLDAVDNTLNNDVALASDYYTRTQLNAGQLDSRYDTTTEIENMRVILQNQINACQTIYSEIDEKISNYSIVEEDAGKILDFTSSTDYTVTIPKNTTTEIYIGFQTTIFKSGDGDITISPESGVVLNGSVSDLILLYDYKAVTLIKKDTDVWYAVGAV